MKKNIIIAALTLSCTGLFAQAISDKDLQDIQSSFRKDAPTKALQNIITADRDLKGNSLNRELQGKIDHYFKYRVAVKGITNQHSSGRCWMFTSISNFGFQGPAIKALSLLTMAAHRTGKSRLRTM